MIKQILIISTILFSTSAMAQKDKIVGLNDLPSKAQQFIKANFSKTKINSIIRETEDYFGHSFEVLMDNKVKIEFNRLGEWKEVDGNKKAIPTDFIPHKIMAYLKRSFPNNEVVKIEKSKRKYEVKISNGLELEFDLKENFLRIDS